MAKNNQKEKEEREKDKRSLEWDLNNDFYQKVLGTNELRRNPAYFGEVGYGIGKGQYDEVMTSKEAGETRNKLYKFRLKEADDLGIADKPDVPSNYDVSKYAVQIINNAVHGLPLGNLEEILVGISPGANLEIPEELKEYSGVEEDLSGEDREAISLYKIFALQAIKRGVAFKIIDEHRYDDINNQGKRLGEAYKKRKEKYTEPKEQRQEAA